MRRGAIWSIFLLLLPAILYSETKYVSEIREITLRTGPGADYKITAMVKSGTPLTILEEGETWTRIQLDNGKDCWVLSQFLQTEAPDSIILEKLQKEHSTLSGDTETIRNENRELKEKLDKLTADFNQTRKEFETLNTTHKTLVKESADFIVLKAEHGKTADNLAQQKEKADRLENELASLTNDKRLKWFLGGAGVLFAGIIFGYITKPRRRRSTLR